MLKVSYQLKDCCVTRWCLLSGISFVKMFIRFIWCGRRQKRAGIWVTQIPLRNTNRQLKIHRPLVFWYLSCFLVMRIFCAQVAQELSRLVSNERKMWVERCNFKTYKCPRPTCAFWKILLCDGKSSISRYLHMVNAKKRPSMILLGLSNSRSCRFNSEGDVKSFE